MKMDPITNGGNLCIPDDTPTGPPPTSPAEDPYDRSRSLLDDSGREGEECGTVTRR